MLPDIDSLALFVRAAEYGSLTKAAEASNIGAAGASRRIALLEARFKTPLFERSPRGMKLTPAGEWLLSYARPLLNQMSEMQLVMKDFATGRSGALRVLINASAFAESFVEDLASFTNGHSNCDLVVEERWSDEIIGALMRAEADLGIVVGGEGPLDGLETFVYRSDHLGLVIPVDHPLARHSEIRFRELPLNDLVTLEAGSSISRLLSEQATALEQTFQPTLQVRNFAAIATIVQKGLGIGVMPLEIASTLRTGGAVIRPLSEPWAKRDMLVCVRAERTCNPVLSKLLKHLSYPGGGASVAVTDQPQASKLRFVGGQG